MTENLNVVVAPTVRWLGLAADLLSLATLTGTSASQLRTSAPVCVLLRVRNPDSVGVCIVLLSDGFAYL